MLPSLYNKHASRQMEIRRKCYVIMFIQKLIFYRFIYIYIYIYIWRLLINAIYLVLCFSLTYIIRKDILCILRRKIHTIHSRNLVSCSIIHKQNLEGRSRNGSFGVISPQSRWRWLNLGVGVL